ncbi:MAG: hypothetical protein ACLRSW_15725 [Christensenellaceae bacterium]
MLASEKGCHRSFGNVGRKLFEERSGLLVAPVKTPARQREMLNVEEKRRAFKLSIAQKSPVLRGILSFVARSGEIETIRKNIASNPPKISRSSVRRGRSGAGLREKGNLSDLSAGIPKEAWDFCRYFPNIAAAATARSLNVL